LRNVLLAGFSGIPGSDNDEVALDIEMAISMAPGLSEVVIYEAPNATPLFGNPYWVDILDEMAYPTQGEPLPKQLSSSWTFGIENDNPTAAQIYQEFALQGQSFFQCSGDFGAYYSGLFGLPWLGIPAWADSSYVTIVGGTELTTGSGGSWSSETTWNGGYDAVEGRDVASGGGISGNYIIPSWQQGIDMSANGGSLVRTKRTRRFDGC
jgi:subtilase family serine protease